jgi:hypothetical protein
MQAYEVIHPRRVYELTISISECWISYLICFAIFYDSIIYIFLILQLIYIDVSVTY